MSKEIDDNGFWLIEDNPVSIEGVYPYLGKTIDARLEPDRIYQVYRPFEELSNPETLKSFDGIPFIDDHEMLGEGFTPADKRPAAGVMMNPRAENGMLRADLKIFSEGMKDKIAGGKKELSLGYQCSYQLKRGVWNGKPYDAIQRDLRGNHIALVDKGRMGAEVRVYDRAVTCDALDITQAITSPANQKENKPMPEENKDLDKKNEATDESVDKRKLIDDLGGFLKDKGLSDEDIRFAIKIAEKIAYNASEAGKATDEAEEEKKDADKDAEAEKKDAEDKCGKDGCAKDEEEEKKDEEKKSDEAKDGKGKDEFFDGLKLHKLIDDMEAKKEISAEAASKIKNSKRYSREGNNAADSLADIVAAEVAKQLAAKQTATDSADKKPGKVYGLAEDAKPEDAPGVRSAWLNEFLNKKN